MTLKLVPAPSRTFTVPAVRYQFPVTLSGGGALDPDDEPSAGTRYAAEHQPVSPLLLVICLQVASLLAPMAVTTSLSARVPITLKFVPGPSRTLSLFAVTRYWFPVGGGGGGGGGVVSIF